MQELIIEAKTENLDEVLDFVGGLLEMVECPMKLQTQIAIAVEEIFVNICHYAYNPDSGNVTVRVMAEDNIEIEFEDSGKPYNPLEKGDPDITKGVEEREIGGLGIFMVKNIMDAVEYRYEFDKNILKIKKQVL